MFEAEIKQIVTDLTAARDRPVSSMEFVAALIERWGVHGEQDPRYQLATWQKIKDEVQSIVRSMKRKSELPTQERELFDFDHLQALYVVEIDGDSHVVPLDLMSREQLSMKSAEHKAQGKGHFEHAKEIDRFIATKFERNVVLTLFETNREEPMAGWS